MAEEQVQVDLTRMTSKLGGVITSETHRRVATFNWTIPDFYNEFRPEMNVWLRSPEIFVHKTKPPHWKLYLIVRNSQLDFFLKYFVGSKEDKPKSTVNVSLGNKENSRFITKFWSEAKKSDEEFGFRFYPFMTIPELDKQKDTLLENHTLRVCVDIEIVDSNSNTDSIIELAKYTNGLLSDFANLFNSKKFSDVVIKCQDEIFNCHKNILSARSQVFAEMLSSEMKEEGKGEIIIVDVDPIIFSIILHYIYTGKVKKLPEVCSLIDLVNGAEKYDLQELKTLCFQKLLDSLSLENAGDIAVAAYLFNADEKAQKFIKNYCHEHIKTLMENLSYRDNIFFVYPKAFYPTE